MSRKKIKISKYDIIMIWKAIPYSFLMYGFEENEVIWDVAEINFKDALKELSGVITSIDFISSTSNLDEEMIELSLTKKEFRSLFVLLANEEKFFLDKEILISESQKIFDKLSKNSKELFDA